MCVSLRSRCCSRPLFDALGVAPAVFRAQFSSLSSCQVVVVAAAAVTARLKSRCESAVRWLSVPASLASPPPARCRCRAVTSPSWKRYARLGWLCVAAVVCTHTVGDWGNPPRQAHTPSICELSWWVTVIAVARQRNRLGGKCFTSDALGYPLDLGAAWIHGPMGHAVRIRSGGSVLVSCDTLPPVTPSSRNPSRANSSPVAAATVSAGGHSVCHTVHCFLIAHAVIVWRPWLACGVAVFASGCWCGCGAMLDSRVYRRR